MRRTPAGLPLTPMRSLFDDLRLALRALAMSPGFTVVVVLTLGISIGATTAVYSVVDGVLLRPLPFDRPDQLVRPTWDRTVRAGWPFNAMGLTHLEERSRSYSSFGVHLSQPSSVTVLVGGEHRRVRLGSHRPVVEEHQSFLLCGRALERRNHRGGCRPGAGEPRSFIYAVLAHSVRLRRGEIGLRMAPGASGRDALGLVLRDGLWLAALGVIVGLVGAAGTAPILAAMLFGVTPFDLPTYGAAVVIFVTVAICACVVPAMRAARVPPAVALRGE